MLKLLVPVGHAPRSLQAVRHAAFLYRERCASEVVLVNVQPPLEATRLEAFHPLSRLRSIEEKFANDDLASARRILQEAGVRYSVVRKVGPVAASIAAAAAETGCDEIVVVAPKRDPFHAVMSMFGRSVMDRLMRISNVPITAVR
ncbi:universal stress protein [Burkholderia multivorans]|uniref:UspA domain-containing protein n=1 Tax=Burkholderia multivorans (strain ATCC 17616 / 249) TaxID=395019 RepID=A0A0H3KMQ7_BURM1|nr:universal stress protein [Burkholderia multivorans]ABX17685.1 UspA domain protein [Burkholderia multivorans ATCC 17616]KWF70640.1 universal stress protein A [Burkholderia multivorans]KWF79902.1 universal stress protein A [Burkholderia multivorans]MBU9350332.1 universal stress protein [Burkholderia multivorans]MBU9392632.1 universal stress protein [Burkholderia multivorans]